MCLHKITLVDKGELPEDTMLPRAWDFDFFFFLILLWLLFFCVFLRDSTAKKAKFDATLCWADELNCMLPFTFLHPESH